MTQALNTTENRQFTRYGLDCGVRFLVNGNVNDNARLVDISCGGAAISHRARPPLGAAIVAYIEGIDRFEGGVARFFRRGFAIQFRMSARKRERLMAALGSVTGPDVPGGVERRAIPRVETHGESVLCRLDNGEIIECMIVDCSVANANLVSRSRPFLGTSLQVGRSRARVTRHTTNGFAVEFEDYWRARPPADSFEMIN